MDILKDMLKKTLERNLLKYSAGRAICCPRCNQIADYRSWVIWDSPAGQTGANCADCWRLGLQKVHDDKPHSYLLSVGWQVTTLVNFEKKPKEKRKGFPITKAALDRALRSDIFKQQKRMGNCTKHDRLFPEYVCAQLIGNKTADGIDYNYDRCAEFSGLQIADYVAEYCRLNHLTGGST